MQVHKRLEHSQFLTLCVPCKHVKNLFKIVVVYFSKTLTPNFDFGLNRNKKTTFKSRLKGKFRTKPKPRNCKHYFLANKPLIAN